MYGERLVASGERVPGATANRRPPAAPSCHDLMIIPVTTSGWRCATDGTGHPAAANRQPLPSVQCSSQVDRQRAAGDERRAGHGSICLAPPAGFRTRRGASVMTIRTAADRRRRANGGHGGALLSRADACSAARSEPLTAQRTHLLMNPGIRLGGQRWADAPRARSPLAVTARNQRGKAATCETRPAASRSPHPARQTKKYPARCPHQARYFHCFNPVDSEPMFQNTTQDAKRLETNGVFATLS